ncbi:hypothetical protein BCR41DRAFT_416445 [Lobosporangium transversale]|uniref:Uncharacterized protein n=1 Tax=Lobosporangium transversale TaxID=64571 RepID=A0A1Y2G9H0_9FUNG|nr:hypothetical protein BCR41DRAFT_416445 [Lobosporangium transversale]ORY95148.1 hypothetical protein BCR41DRAFT_416445 [Lobosporangium transversale]|eukprot:XP_021875355.1 hypothetical protein BCR41DRAFT_416445 [Lobosporangium transversale]
MRVHCDMKMYVDASLVLLPFTCINFGNNDEWIILTFFSCSTFYYPNIIFHHKGSDHEKSKSLQIKDVVKSISSSDFVQLKVIPGNKERTKSLASQPTYRTVEALYDQRNVNSPRKTHGGRHAGTIEAHRLGISQDDIKQAGGGPQNEAAWKAFICHACLRGLFLGWQGSILSHSSSFGTLSGHR